jgi:hypothetical protein
MTKQMKGTRRDDLISRYHYAAAASGSAGVDHPLNRTGIAYQINAHGAEPADVERLGRNDSLAHFCSCRLGQWIGLTEVRIPVQHGQRTRQNSLDCRRRSERRRPWWGMAHCSVRRNAAGMGIRAGSAHGLVTQVADVLKDRIQTQLSGRGISQLYMDLAQIQPADVMGINPRHPIAGHK